MESNFYPVRHHLTGVLENAGNGSKSRSDLQPPGFHSENSTRLPELRRMDQLWQILAETFGSAFTTPYGHSPNNAWISALRDLGADELMRGVDSLLTWAEPFPPNALQFRQLCRPMTTKAHDAYVPLPEPESDFEQRKRVADEAIRSLREGCLKPSPTAMSQATEETKLLLKALDGDPEGLALAKEMLERDSGCTCVIGDPLERRLSETCPFCLALYSKAEANRALALEIRNGVL